MNKTLYYLMIFGFVVVFFSGFFSGLLARDTYLDNKVGINNISINNKYSNDFYINYTGYVTEIEFVHPYIMLIKFDDGYRLAFEYYNFQVPENKNVTFIYHEGYNFKDKNPIYILDNFTIHEP